MKLDIHLLKITRTLENKRCAFILKNCAKNNKAIYQDCFKQTKTTFYPNINKFRLCISLFDLFVTFPKLKLAVGFLKKDDW
jgi:UDP-N-acetylglucosamine pyrophosphorylase